MTRSRCYTNKERSDLNYVNSRVKRVLTNFRKIDKSEGERRYVTKLQQGELGGLPNVSNNPNLQDLTLFRKYQQAGACQEGCKHLEKQWKVPMQAWETFQPMKYD